MRRIPKNAKAPAKETRTDDSGRLRKDFIKNKYLARRKTRYLPLGAPLSCLAWFDLQAKRIRNVLLDLYVFK